MLEKLITEVLTIADLKALYGETFLNHTSKVSKISDLSVLNAHAFGVAKLFQKDLKDTAIIESQMYPELSSGNYLDNAAKLVGGLARLQQCGSSTFVLVYADPATIYIPGQSTFVSSQGVLFNITTVVIVGDNGYAYIPVRSISTGSNTNVDALTINKIISPPTGHLNCTNEYSAIGGRDNETDEDFKLRLSTFAQFASKTNKARILEVLKTLDNDIIQLKNVGYTNESKLALAIITCNGKWFTTEELSNFENLIGDYLSLTDVNDQGGVLGVELQNIEWDQVGGASGLNFRIDIFSGYDSVAVRKSIQIQLTKYFDFRYFTKTKVEWDDLLQIVKSVQGVKYVPDEYFLPHTDRDIPTYKLPRIIKFIMSDMSGSVIFDNNSAVLPIYYNQ